MMEPSDPETIVSRDSGRRVKAVTPAKRRRPPAIPRTSEVVRAFVSYNAAMGRKPKTLEAYRWALAKLEAVCQEMPRSGRDIVQVFGDADSLGDVSRRTLYRHLNVFLRWAEREYGLPNPMLQVEKPAKPKTLPRVFTVDEIQSVWSVAESPRLRGERLTGSGFDPAGLPLGHH